MLFGILGATRATAEDGGELALGGPRPRSLLALLLLDAGRVVGTDRLIDGLYGEEPPREAANALQAQVSRLRRKLGGDLIELRPAGYVLHAKREDVDVHRFTRLVAAARDTPPAHADELLTEALGLWRGPALADVDAPFAEPERVRLEDLRLAAVEDRAEARLALGQASTLVEELRQLAGRHPLREPLHTLLVRALTGSGRQAEALTAYEDARRTLADELGADPSPALAAAHLTALRAEPLVPQPLPAQLTSFVGRAEELDRVTSLLSASRLVTLTGPGGAGKTRLSIEAAARAATESSFVDLSTLRSGSEVPQAVLSVLGLREGALFTPSGQPDPVARIVAALTDRSALLVFDNCEHVIAETAQLVHRLLTSCPGLRVLATSREPLAITGEALCPLPPLDADAAARLFTERARAVAPEAELDAETVARLCTALDQLPLAIELAAARLRTIPLAQLEERIEDRFRLLSRGSRTAAPRHRTLRAVVEWSWELLDEEEQQLARRLAVFAGGVTHEAADTVLGDGGLLDGLAEKSLLEAGNGRFRMLDTIRAYSAERLEESGERDRFSRAHAEYFLDLARTADRYLRGKDQLTWLAKLSAEHANLRAALHWAADADHRLALRLFGALTTYWRLQGVAGEVAPVAAKLLASLGSDIPDELAEEYVLTVLAAGLPDGDEHLRRAEALVPILDWPLRQPFLVVAWALHTGPPAPDLPLPPLAQRIAASDDPWCRALIHFSMSFLGLFNGRLAEAEREFLVSLELFRSLGDRWGMAQVLDGLAALTELTGDRERGLALTEEAIDLVGQLGAVEELAELWCHRANRRLADDPEAARADYAKSAELARRAGVPVTLAMAHLGFAELARRQGDLGQARRWGEQALDECASGWQNSNTRIRALTTLGRIAEAEGSFTEARLRHDEAIRLALENRLRLDMADPVAASASLSLAEGDTEGAAERLALASALRGVPFTDDAEIERVRAAVARESRAMTPEEAVARLRELVP